MRAEGHERSSAGHRAGGPGALIVVVLLTALGAGLRLVVAQQSLFADELSTWWIVNAHGLRGVVSTVSSDAEITPPLFFVLAWLARRLGDAPALLRAPSLVAGIAMIPLVYALGLRTVGRSAALLATALTALGPFAIAYSAGARGYALMMAAVVLSTLALLLAVDTGRARWWAVHAVAVAVAVYSHYTCVFVLAAQLGWVLWVHPRARRAALAATAGAIVLFLPWVGGLLADFGSPTTKILSALSPFNWASVRFSVTHWIIGYPAAIAFPLRDFPGVPAVLLVVLGAAVAGAAALVRAVAARARPRLADVDRRLILVVLLSMSAAVAQAALNLVGVHLFSVRNLAPSWPAAILALSALLVAAGPRLRIVVATMAVAGFAIAAVQLVQPRFQNPDYRGAARFVDEQAGPRDLVVDASGELSPGPVTGLDVELKRPHRLLRAAAPEARDQPFTILDPVVTTQDAIGRAVVEAAGARVLLVSTRFSEATAKAQVANVRTRARRNVRFPDSWSLVERRDYPGVVGVVVRVYAPR